jgi:glutamate-1-semialdehyde 2,1-aminomutase
MSGALAVAVLGGALLAWALLAFIRRLELSRAKHPSLAGHPRLARLVARLVPAYDYDDEGFFRSDGAPPEVGIRRRAAFERLGDRLGGRAAAGLALTEQAAADISDLQLAAACRVPFPYKDRVRRRLRLPAFVRASDGVTLQDLDGNRAYDLSGSYGVNLFGYRFHHECIERGMAHVRELGPVLGPYHPLVAQNARELRAISGLDEVSFHMSGTEAVMQAVRLARYHTGRSHLVRFCGAYHGWWDGVQPGVGNPRPVRETYTLREMDERTLRVLRHRRDVACVLVNPLQALHPNAVPPTDAALVDSSRRAGFDRAAYAAWLRDLREVTAERGIALVFDEVFVGFRLAPGGAQEYFGVRADLVTYGKGLGGGLPVGVLCGRKELMRRFKDDRPADLCFARGTFNSHPYVMGAMHEFLARLATPEVKAVYAGLDETWRARAAALDRRLREEDLGLGVANLSSIFTVLYERPGRYNWMLQFYLRAQGLVLGWPGTGRLIFSLDYGDAAFHEVTERFVAAARAMREDGWCWSDAALTDAAIRRRILREMLARRFRGTKRPGGGGTAPVFGPASGQPG